MGAIARQVAQVNLKNSTNCSPPAARLTVVGSVAWSSGPREVARGKGEGTADSVETAVIDLELARVGKDVGLMAAGAQAARNRATQIRLGKRRILVIKLLVYITY